MKSYIKNVRAYDLDLEHKALPLEKFHRNNEVLTAEASWFGRAEVCPWWLTQLYNDACDVGIGIRSHKTGRIVRFSWSESLGQNADYTGGYAAWHFTVVASDNDQPIKKVVIFND